MNKFKITTMELVYLGLAVALLEISKLALEFLPNVELVTLLFIIYSIFFGRKTLLVAVGFVAIECFLKGVSVWVLMYLYIWPLLILAVCFAHKRKAGYLFYCILSGVFGLVFGFLCMIPNFFIGGVSMAIGWWISGIPYDILHGVSNFIICLVLFKPLYSVMKRICNLYYIPQIKS